MRTWAAAAAGFLLGNIFALQSPAFEPGSMDGQFSDIDHSEKRAVDCEFLKCSTFAADELVGNRNNRPDMDPSRCAGIREGPIQLGCRDAAMPINCRWVFRKQGEPRSLWHLRNLVFSVKIADCTAATSESYPYVYVRSGRIPNVFEHYLEWQPGSVPRIFENAMYVRDQFDPWSLRHDGGFSRLLTMFKTVAHGAPLSIEHNQLSEADRNHYGGENGQRQSIAGKIVSLIREALGAFGHAPIIPKVLLLVGALVGGGWLQYCGWDAIDRADKCRASFYLGTGAVLTILSILGFGFGFF